MELQGDTLMIKHEEEAAAVEAAPPQQLTLDQLKKVSDWGERARANSKHAAPYREQPKHDLKLYILSTTCTILDIT